MRWVYVFWKETRWTVKALFNIQPARHNVRDLRVAFPGMGAPIRWYISSKAKYLLESNSEQVPWGKDAKYFEKRVICAWNHCITSTWILFFRWISWFNRRREPSGNPHGVSPSQLNQWNLPSITNVVKGAVNSSCGSVLWTLRMTISWHQVLLSKRAGFPDTAYSDFFQKRMRWGQIKMCCQVRILFGIGTKRFQMTRLETRTKESTHVCEYVPKNGMCGMKVKVLICVCRNNRLQFSERGLSVSTSVGTRKMVNYIWGGWSQGKLWWKLVAILTCKSFVTLGHRGERLIELSSSWFPSKFPSG